MTTLPSLSPYDGPSGTPSGGGHAWTLDLWTAAIEEEWLMDLAEWEHARSTPRADSADIAFTRRLWDTLSRIPFADIGRVQLDHRVQAVLPRARLALDRTIKLAENLTPPGEVLDFSAPLASHCEDRQQRLLRLHVETGPSGQPLVTVGLANEFVHHPLESLLRGR